MKSVFVFLSLLCLAPVCWADDNMPTPKAFSSVVYGGPVVRITTLNQRFATILGLHMGLIADHRLTLGLGGYGVATQFNEPDGYPGEKLSMFYAGCIAGYIHKYHRTVHSTIHFLVGGGMVSRTTSSPLRSVRGTPDAFFVIEPATNLEFNVTDAFQMEAGIGYRSVTGVTSFGVADADLSGPTVSLAFKFGRFKTK